MSPEWRLWVEESRGILHPIIGMTEMSSVKECDARPKVARS